MAATIAAVLGGFGLLVGLVLAGLPQVAHAEAASAGNAQAAPHDFHIMDGGRVLAFSGGITSGVAAEFGRFLDAMDDVRIVRLTSTGGQLIEAQNVADLIRRRNLVTIAAGDCLSACAIMFLGGKDRLLVSGGRIGFGAAAMAAADVAWLQRFGLSPEFAAKVASPHPDGIWFPSTSELIREGIVTRVVASPDAGVNTVDGPQVGRRDVFPSVSPSFTGPPQAAVVPANPPSVPAPRPAPGIAGLEVTRPAGAQAVVLYEEDPGEPQGRRYDGTVVWRVERKPASDGGPPEVVLAADIAVPARAMKMALTMRRNTDASLPASHTVTMAFSALPVTSNYGVDSMPGILMKASEQSKGIPLAGLVVKVSDGVFLAGLSNAAADRDRNIPLLKERSWFDIPIVYRNRRRAILAVAKGESGMRAFAEAFAAWAP
ncbi:hypothetical protein JQ557_01410 [Bradyrhizobium sp. U87765 SZCCT0131]|uniref:hypothetical protein n=1 Tax=unclassified Bradyrhizobium TaxID=2631580 RepID=UPI001BA8598E|nr:MULTISPECIES: hypothetical protein [unclassified Bradyrhizobium]MBR1216631.1 hypothetical protein [Bradyrhizobium sp. U87765 SZCCT0131]MBR1259613.1 hypothetical protein [Bradyrhizobium sp. U87765 SZCCT0134]MBR1305754.1 hypothetical protein [Bradyrhizobium sp. U87765 SZCCT0110]MBR1322121.1 hypothetical protein [Bradyrhizobium sp. U87765 SZCCT0109]MBR1350601.1 hypothetical protein [Bradyrhizobium sp. U87765 SZCCT0048]